MAQITQRQLREIRSALGKLDSKTAEIVADVINEVGVSDVQTLKAALLERVKPVAKASASSAERIARVVYNAWRKSSIGESMQVESAGTWEEGKFEAAVNTAANKASEGATTEDVARLIATRCRYDNRRAYGETIRHNASIDPSKPRYARITSSSAHYSDGCPFCRMLSSRGFVYHNRETAGEFDHYHADCRCVVAPSWDDNPKVQSYNPDELYDEYSDARKYAEDNVDELRKRESVYVKVAPRYKNGRKVGDRVMDYRQGIQANDISAAYRDLGIAEKK